MIATLGEDYRKLEIESSNLLMEWDGQKVLGRDVEAAYAAFRAGLLRARMGQMRLDDGDWTGAAEDCLSAIDCFVQAGVMERAISLFERLGQESAGRGGLPPGRDDLASALAERETSIRQLCDQVERRLTEFFETLGYREDVRDRDALDYLMRFVRDFPGWADWHLMIFRQADAHGEEGLADRHIRWAWEFAPEKPLLVSLLGYRLMRKGQFDEARALGETFLAGGPPDSVPVRLMLASALTRPGVSAQDERRAIDLLRPLDSPQTPTNSRLSALASLCLFHLELGEIEEAKRYLRQVENLEWTMDEPWAKAKLIEIRRFLAARIAGAERHPDGSPEPMSPQDRLLIFSKFEGLAA
jgi:tetratricopeptide (TPR) repeat protein